VNQVFARRKRRDAFLQDESKLLFNLRDDRRKRAAAVARLVFNSIPTVGIVTRSDDDAAGGFVVPHQKRNCRRRARLVRKPYWCSGSADDFSNGSCHAIRGVAVVITDDQALARVLAANHIAHNRMRHDPRVGERKILRDNPAPTIRAKCNLGNHW
jgi:hypothetical protein